ncbi:MAG: hypothetical protein LBU27_08915 [Candidatus Peribacteria bacterium]|jgi:hypothetical protein|nr:hypothetical protein [Candidatus Peribacteria bacterium]
MFEIEGAGISVNKYSQYPSQKEVLINRGEKFIIGDRYKENDYLVITLRK